MTSYRNLIAKYRGKTFTITYYADGSTAWFVYGIKQPYPIVEEFWSVVMMDRIAEAIDSRIAYEEDYAS